MNKYSVYIHTCPNGKKYVGLTIAEPQKRWGENGIGYEKQEHFYRAIKKYGWDNIKHEIVLSGLQQFQAVELEITLISLFDTTNPKKGYNKDLGGGLGSVGKVYGRDFLNYHNKKHNDSGKISPELTPEEILLIFKKWLESETNSLERVTGRNKVRNIFKTVNFKLILVFKGTTTYKAMKVSNWGDINGLPSSYKKNQWCIQEVHVLEENEDYSNYDLKGIINNLNSTDLKEKELAKTIVTEILEKGRLAIKYETPKQTKWREVVNKYDLEFIRKIFQSRNEIIEIRFAAEGEN